MNMDKILVGLFSIVGMVFTYWFFLMKKEEVVSVQDSMDSSGSPQVDIFVDGGYSPDTISIPLGKTTKINFFRKDQSTCLEEVVISDFKIRKYLPLNQKVSVDIIPKNKGSFNFSCGMGMFHGKLIVK